MHTYIHCKCARGQAEEHHQQVLGWESERVRMRESQLELLKERDSQLAQAAADRDAGKEKLLAAQVANPLRTRRPTYIHLRTEIAFNC